MADRTDRSDTGLAVWNRVLSAALALPGARIDRAAYLRSALGAYLPMDEVEAAIKSTPAKAGISKSLLKRASTAAIKWHRTGVTAASTVAGLPGGWWLVATVPVDLGQFFWHTVVVSQKLAYLHGWPELLPEGDDVDDETKLVLTLFIGVMLGAQGATEGLSKLATAASREVVKRLPGAPLTKYALYNVAKQVAKWLGVKLTKKKFAEVVGRAVPLVGGAVAGTLTWIAFGGGAARLHEHLKALPLAEGKAG
jgi:hypothetical protein